MELTNQTYQKMETYGFNSSQDIINLQTKFSLFGRVANIVFSVTVEDGFDRKTMAEAIDKVIERVDSLRITFTRKDRKTVQHFVAERKIGRIPYMEFEKYSDLTAYVNRFRKKALNCFKGETIKACFAKNPDGKDMILFKVSHYVADTYGISIIVNDLMSVYEALRDGTELPAAPGKFEDVLKKDLAYIDNDEAVEKDREFFKDYYIKRHPEHPEYCGIHGNNSDRWLKFKKKGIFSLPYLFVKCDTNGYKFEIPSAVTALSRKWCEKSGISMSTFYFYTCAITASLLNGKAKYQLPLELINCRGTVAEKRCAGTKVQSLSVYTTVDYEKSFNENIALLYEDQSQLYRHTRLSYLEVQDMQHDLWKYSMLSQITNFSFSFIPMTTPKGVTTQVYSNGKGALVAYIALMHDIKTDVIDVIYDIQTKMLTPEILIEFQNTYVRVIETVLAEPDSIMDKLF